VIVVVAFVCGICSACSSYSTPHRSASTTTVLTTANVAPDHAQPPAACSNPSRFGAGGAAQEIHARSVSGQIWGLALGPGHVPPRPGEELKIVWRMTGVGPLRVVFTAPDGHVQPLVFGPERHAGGSTYRRPGDEWGTSFRFSVRGCWRIHLSREDTSGDVWLVV
jgi:hypothetical protein